MIALQMASPRPTPRVDDSWFPRVNLPKSASSFPLELSGKPGPKSRTVTTSVLVVMLALTTMAGLAAGLVAPYLAAFSSRLTKTRSMRLASTSSVTLLPLPLLSVYTSSKAAVNAFTESLALELAPFNVRARLVLPGRAPSTRFGANARPRMAASLHEAYADFTQSVFAAVGDTTTPVTHTQDVVEAVWRAVTDPAAPMRIPAGADAVALA